MVNIAIKISISINKDITDLKKNMGINSSIKNKWRGKSLSIFGY